MKNDFALFSPSVKFEDDDGLYLISFESDIFLVAFVVILTNLAFIPSANQAWL